MPNRDYAARSKKSGKSVNKLLILIIVLLLLGMSALALMLLSSKEPVKTEISPPVAIQPQKSELPTPPAEIYSYIRDLETREVPVDKNARIAQLTREQEQQLQRLQEEEKRKQALAELKENIQIEQMQPNINAVEPNAQDKKVVALTAEEFEAKTQAEQKAAEEKSKQAELRKQQDAKRAADLQAQKAKEVAQVKESNATKVVAKPANEAPKVIGKFGLQCGAFKNKAQAENMQARLAMAGYNARINSNGEWNRVVVGPIGDRAAASQAQANARSVAECLIVGM